MPRPPSYVALFLCRPFLLSRGTPTLRVTLSPYIYDPTREFSGLPNFALVALGNCLLPHWCSVAPISNALSGRVMLYRLKHFNYRLK